MLFLNMSFSHVSLLFDMNLCLNGLGGVLQSAAFLAANHTISHNTAALHHAAQSQSAGFGLMIITYVKES